MRLHDALGVQRGEIVAFVGAGGKTSAMLRLGYELKDLNWRILATTTTKIGENELKLFPYAIRIEHLKSAQGLSELLNKYGFVFLYEGLWKGKAIGVGQEVISHLTDSLDSDVVLVEADGARRLQLKAPHRHEPAIPSEATLVVPVASMEVMGQPLDDSAVYNVERIIEQYGFPRGEPIQHAWIAQIVRDEALGIKGVPDRARIIPLLNRAGTTMIDRIKTRRTAQLILQQPRIQAVAVGRIQRRKRPVFEVQRRVAAIVLAGGLSRRMGQSKPLLPWGKQTVIESIVKRLMPLRLAEMVVVTGYESGAVQLALKGTGVRTVYNADYASGEMLSSLQTGIKALDASISACLVVLGDQPQLSPRLVNEILITYAEGGGTIVAPSYNHKRGHPILIDRRYWPELLDLPSGSAPRDVINAYADQTAYILTKDDSILRDMDTPEQYREELKRAGLL